MENKQRPQSGPAEATVTAVAEAEAATAKTPAAGSVADLGRASFSAERLAGSTILSPPSESSNGVFVSGIQNIKENQSSPVLSVDCLSGGVGSMSPDITMDSSTQTSAGGDSLNLVLHQAEPQHIYRKRNPLTLCRHETESVSCNETRTNDASKGPQTPTSDSMLHTRNINLNTKTSSSDTTHFRLLRSQSSASTVVCSIGGKKSRKDGNCSMGDRNGRQTLTQYERQQQQQQQAGGEKHRVARYKRRGQAHQNQQEALLENEHYIHHYTHQSPPHHWTQLVPPTQTSRKGDQSLQMQQANKVAGGVTGSGLSGRSQRQQSGGLARKPSADGSTRYEYEAEDSEMEDGMGVSQGEWESEVGGRVELPTGLEKTLTAQILHTYETRLFPSAESIEAKRAFIEKFAAILTHEFPGVEMDIHVFGSSVNGLSTSRSDVDICLTTERRELENIFVINKALRRHDMRTYCIPYARVPLVKAWDPELRVASDINVNSTIALHNTRMIQTFVAIDSRVRPFVMAVKHWTKTRELNDAAFGGTLSPYAWVNLALHFLQTRSPPILPVLHPPSRSLNALQSMHDETPDLSFNDNIHALRGFGLANTESLGFLLYAFFRTYAYEFDYRHQVVSLRHGCTLTKAQKGWDFGRPARIFCIEEPFLTWLNLGHSANTTSVVGIRLEFKRAFQILRSGGSFDEVCEVYQRPQRSLPLSPVQSVSSVSTAVNGHRRTGSSSSSSGGSGNGGSGFSSATRSGLRRAASLQTDKNTRSRHHDNSHYQQLNYHRYKHVQDHQDLSYHRQQDYYAHMLPGSAGTLADAFERVSLTPSEDNGGMDIQLANASDATLTAADYERLPSSYSTGYCLSAYGVYHSTVPLSQKHEMQRRESYDSTAMYCPADVAEYPGAPRNRSRQPIQHWHATPSHIYAHQQRDGYNHSHNHDHHRRAQSIVGGALHHTG